MCMNIEKKKFEFKGKKRILKSIKEYISETFVMWIEQLAGN